MAAAGRVLALGAQRSVVLTTCDPASQKSKSKDAILQCLTRLNERSTLKAAAEELATIGLDHDSLAALVQGICSTGTWEPKPLQQKECIRVLAQLPLATCPVADAALQQHLPKILSHLKKHLQNADGLVRDAACEALAAYAWALAEASGSPLPGSASHPLVKAVFDCLAEQKKEGQLGASQALLMVAPCLGPLDKDLVKLVLRLLRSATFQGTAALLSAVASTEAGTHAPQGLLKSGCSAFLPYLTHLIGQPSGRRSSNQDPGSMAAAAAAATGAAAGNGNPATSSSGFIGCLGSKDWAVRRAAADAVRAAVLLLGPALEPEGCWGLGDPGSLTHRCLNALEGCRFDKVKEARDAAREAAALLQELHHFVQAEGPAGDWGAWVAAHVPHSGCAAPAEPSSAERPATAALRSSPVRPCFQQAALQADVVADASTSWAGDDEQQQAEHQTLLAPSASSEGAACSATADAEPLACISAGTPPPAHDEARPAEQQQPQQQHSQELVLEAPRRQWSRTGGAVSSSSGSAPASRPASRPGSRRSTADPAPPPAAAAAAKRQSSHAVREPGGSAAAAADQSVLPGRARVGAAAAATGRTSGRSSGRVSPADGAAGREQQQLSRSGSSSSSSGGRHKERTAAADASAVPGPAAAAWAPSSEEWQLLLQRLAQCQAELLQCQQQQQLMTDAMQQLTQTHLASLTALQERISALEAHQQQQQQQRAAGAGWSLGGLLPPPPCNSSSPSRMAPLRSRSSNSSAAGTAAPGSLAGMRQGPSTPGDQQQQQQQQGCGGSEPSGRLFRSLEDWSSINGSGTGGDSSSGGKGRPSLVVVPGDQLAAVRRSFSGAGLATPGAGARSGGESLVATPPGQVATPGDLEAAYGDALRGDRGDVHLARLMQKTGPVWGELTVRTSRALLAVFIRNVREGVLLHRVLPWLWRLADEDAGAGRPDVPWEAKQQLLEALQCCPAAEDPQGQEKVALLAETLRAVWLK